MPETLFYVLIFSVATFYFLVKRRRIDIFVLAHFTLLLYSMTFFDDRICITSKICHTNIPSDFQLSYAIVDLILFFLALIKDSKHSIPIPSPIRGTLTFNIYSQLLIVTNLGLILYIIATTPILVLLLSHKTILTQSVGVIFELYIWLNTVFTISMFFREKNKLTYFLLAIGIIVPFLLGDRTSPVMSTMGLSYLYLRSLPKVSIIFSLSSLRLLTFALCFVMFFGSIKAFYSDLRTASSLSNIQEGFQRRGLISYVQSGFEFDATNYIFADIIKVNYSDSEYIMESSLLSVLPIPRTWISSNDSSEFGRKFQNKRLQVNFGAAYSVLGEFYSNSGVFGICMFAVLYGLILSFIDYVFSRFSSRFILIMMSSIVGLSVFYIFRNLTSTYLGFVRFVIYPQLILLFVSSVLSSVIRHFNDSSAHNN